MPYPCAAAGSTASGLPWSASPTIRTHLGQLLGDAGGGGEEVEEAFAAGGEATDEADHGGVGRDAERGAAAGEVGGGEARRIEAAQVDAVAEVLDLGGAADALAQGGGDVLVVLGEDRVGAAGGEAFQGDVEAAGGGPHGGVEVEAVEGVDHDGHPGEAGGELAEQAGFGGVGVDDREPLTAHDAPESPEGDEVGERADGAGERDGDVADAGGGELRHAGAGGGDADDLVAGLLQALQLVQEQEFEGLVDGGDVGDFWAGHGTCLWLLCVCALVRWWDGSTWAAAPGLKRPEGTRAKGAHAPRSPTRKRVPGADWDALRVVR
jgi:hypothetical protein